MNNGLLKNNTALFSEIATLFESTATYREIKLEMTSARFKISIMKFETMALFQIPTAQNEMTAQRVKMTATYKTTTTFQMTKALFSFKLAANWPTGSLPQKCTHRSDFAPADDSSLCSDLKVTRAMLMHPKQRLCKRCLY